MDEDLKKRNLKVLEAQFTIWGLGLFELLSAFLAGFPLVLLAFVLGKLYLIVFALLLSLFAMVLIKKRVEGKPKGYAYRRFESTLRRKILRKRKVIYP